MVDSQELTNNATAFSAGHKKNRPSRNDSSDSKSGSYLLSHLVGQYHRR